MNKILLFISAIFMQGACLFSQTNINLHAISTSRQASGDMGYTLNGQHMTQARVKLLNLANFGVAGTYAKDITIVDSYATSGSLETIGSVSGIDMFYFGIFNKTNPSLVQFTEAELDSLYNWSLKGGKLIIGGGSANPASGFVPSILNSHWNFDLALVYPTIVYPTVFGATTTIFDGPFGVVGSAMQGGSSQGYFNSYPADIVLLADDGAGHPTMYLDCKTLDLVVADGDVFTDLGGISMGNAIINDNDKAWVNIIAYMDLLEGPPVITQVGDVLSTGVYPSYQWFLNGGLIPGENSSSITMTQTGAYSVQVPLECGCTNIASQSVDFVGLSDLEMETVISLYPNPVEGDEISFSGITKSLNVSIYNFSGQLVDQTNIDAQNNHYNSSLLESGIYLVKLFNSNGNLVSVEKLVKL